jgi:hypothetical protein
MMFSSMYLFVAVVVWLLGLGLTFRYAQNIRVQDPAAARAAPAIYLIVTGLITVLSLLFIQKSKTPNQDYYVQLAKAQRSETKTSEDTTGVSNASSSKFTTDNAELAAKE